MSYPLMDTLYSAIFRMSLKELTNVELKRHGCQADLLSRSAVLRRLYCPHHPHLPPLARVTVRIMDADCEDPFHAIRQLKQFREDVGGQEFHQMATSSVAGYREASDDEFDLPQQPGSFDGQSLFGVESIDGGFDQLDGGVNQDGNRNGHNNNGIKSKKKNGDSKNGNKLVFWSGEITSANISLLSLRTAVVEQQQQQQQQQLTMVQEEGGAVRKSVSWSDLQRHIQERGSNLERPSHSLDMEVERKKPKKSAYYAKTPSNKKNSPNFAKKKNGNRLSTSVPPPTFSLTPSSTSSTGPKRTIAQRLFENSSPASSADSRDSDGSTVRKNFFGGRLSAADKFQWKSADSLMSGKVSEEQMLKQIISIHRLVTNRDRFALSQLSKNCPPDLDFSLPLRGVTALSLSVYLRAPDITKELLLIMDRMGQLSRGLNVTSVDSSSSSSTTSNDQQKSDESNYPHRETALVAACRTGQLDCVMLLLHYAHNGSTNKPASSGRFVPLDTELRDGQGRSALWHAVKGGHTAIVAALVEEGGAQVFYQNGDLSCPMQLACRNLKQLGRKGKLIIRYLASHGANLDYVDHALRNALYWTVCISGCLETAVFLLDAGASVQPWSWLQNENLSPALLSSSSSTTRQWERLRRAASAPPPLKALARAACRRRLERYAGGRSIFPVLERLSARGIVGLEEKKLIRLSDLRASTPIPKIRKTMQQ